MEEARQAIKRALREDEPLTAEQILDRIDVPHPVIALNALLSLIECGEVRRDYTDRSGRAKFYLTRVPR